MERRLESHQQDEWIERLARLFVEHPAWVEAANLLSGDATSTVYFTQRPTEVWHLCTQAGGTRLLPGAARDADLVFRFSPESIRALERTDGGIGEFAVALFEEITGDRAQLRIRAPFLRLARRGYVKLLFAAGPKVIAFGARHGVTTLGGLRKLVAEHARRGPSEWETAAHGPTSESGS